MLYTSDQLLWIAVLRQAFEVSLHDRFCNVVEHCTFNTADSTYGECAPVHHPAKKKSTFNDANLRSVLEMNFSNIYKFLSFLF